MAVADVSSDKYKVNYTVELSNYSQCEPTIVKTGENSVRVYFTINDEPGGIYAMKIQKMQHQQPWKQFMNQLGT